MLYFLLSRIMADFATVFPHKNRPFQHFLLDFLHSMDKNGKFGRTANLAVRPNDLLLIQRVSDRAQPLALKALDFTRVRQCGQRGVNGHFRQQR